MRKYRRASSAKARSRGHGVAGRGARASSSAYVADFPRGAPLQITPSSSARPSRCDSRSAVGDAGCVQRGPQLVAGQVGAACQRALEGGAAPPEGSLVEAQLAKPTRRPPDQHRRDQRQQPVQVGRRHELPRPPHRVRADDGAGLDRAAGSRPRSGRVRRAAWRRPSARRPGPGPGWRPSTRPGQPDRRAGVARSLGPPGAARRPAWRPLERAVGPARACRSERAVTAAEIRRARRRRPAIAAAKRTSEPSP